MSDNQLMETIFEICDEHLDELLSVTKKMIVYVESSDE